MGKVIPWEFVTNALFKNKCNQTLSTSDCYKVQIWVEQKLEADHVVVVRCNLTSRC